MIENLAQGGIEMDIVFDELSPGLDTLMTKVL